MIYSRGRMPYADRMLAGKGSSWSYLMAHIRTLNDLVQKKSLFEDLLLGL